MTFASVSATLATLIGGVPGVRSVARGDVRALGTRGALLPEPTETPHVRITRGPETERPFTHSGSYDRRTPYACELFDYTTDLSGRADGFAALAEAVRDVVRRNSTLGGQADTPTTTVLHARLVARPPGGASPRPVSREQGRVLLHDRFGLDVREEVRAP